MGRRSKSKVPKEEEEQLSLDEVVRLGGTVEDFESLKHMQDGARSKMEKVKDTFKDDEFKAFFESVGFDKIFVSKDGDDDSDARKSLKMKNLDKSNQIRRKPATSSLTTQAINTDKAYAKKHRKGSSHEQDGEGSLMHTTPKDFPVQDSLVSSSDESQPTTAFSKVYNRIIELVEIIPKKVVCKPAGPWHAADPVKVGVRAKGFEANDAVVIKLKNLGRKLLENEATLFRNDKKQDDRGDAWMKTAATSGTLSDKVAAYTLMLQKAPIHNYWCLDTFLNMLKKKGKREAIVGLEALRDIFLAELLIDNRRLRFFHEQPIETLKDVFGQEKGGATSKRIELQNRLILWSYEEHLKMSYKQLVESLRDFFLQDSLEALKTKGMKVALELLKSKPEQERELLTMLVNKLGDPKYKVASKALHLLHCLIQEHPLMQGVIVGAVRDLLLRPNVQPKCQYYCICFLSAQILSHDRKDVADLLIQIYLGFFKAAVKKKQVDNKLLSAILTGVNRAYPFANKDDEKILEELNVLYRTVHVSSFGTSVQALMLLFQVLSSRDELNDRYYNALYSSLLHPELPICTNRHPMFLNLLFKSLKSDSSESRVKAFLKRLLQTCSLQLASYTSAVLVLITELLRTKPSLKAFLARGSQRQATSSSKGSGNEKFSSFDDDDDDEHFVDADKESNNSDANKILGKSWTHLHKASSLVSHSSGYDPLHRNPTFANAGYTSLWELHQIRRHYHPTVVKFAVELIDVNKSGLPDRYPGDPLLDFTLMRFLDKFVYRNPKAKQEKDASANAGEATFRRKRKRNMADTKTVAANTPEFLAKKSYSPEELFLQRYFSTRAVNAPQREQVEKSEEESSDIEEISDDEFDRFLDSTEGKAQLESEYNYADGTIGSGNRKQDLDVDDNGSDDDTQDGEDDLGDFGGDDFSEGEGGFEDVDNDPFSETGMTFDAADDDEPPVKRKKKQSNKKSSKADVEALDMMLEENTRKKFGSSGSGAVRNADRSSAKQLQWERKKEAKEIVARKRGQKRGKFSKGKKGSKKFGGKKKFRKA